MAVKLQDVKEPLRRNFAESRETAQMLPNTPRMLPNIRIFFDASPQKSTRNLKIISSAHHLSC
jgi:hypothetical protein